MEKIRQTYKLAEICRTLQKSPNTIKAIFRTLCITPIYIGKQAEYRAEDVENLLERYAKYNSLQGRFDRGEMPIFTQKDLLKIALPAVPISRETGAVFFFEDGAFRGWSWAAPLEAAQAEIETNEFNQVVFIEGIDYDQASHIGRIIQTW